MRVLAGLLAVLLVTSACESSPLPGRTDVRVSVVERELSAPASITLWHAQTGTVAKALQEMVDTFNSTNGQGVTVVLSYQGSFAQLYEKTLGARTC